jgi:Tfp pilus assembly protein PilN
VSQQVNLYQPIFRRQERKFSARAMLQAVGLVVGGVLLMVLYTQWQISSLRSEIKRAEVQQTTVSKRLDDLVRQFSGRIKARTVDEEIARLESEIGAKQQIYDILQRGVFSNSEGFSGYLTALARQNLQGVWLTGFEITGAAEQMMLQGRSVSRELVPRYMQRLSAEKKLSGIEFHTFYLSGAAPQDRGGAGAEVDFQLRTAGAATVATP